jgi:hypothetical protein
MQQHTDPLSPNLRARLRDSVAGATQKSDQVAKSFVAGLLEFPEKVIVELADFRAPLLNLQPGQHEVWLVVKGSPQSVFFDPSSSAFGACWGPDKDTGELVDLGFRGDDPFEMYIA